MMNYDMGEPAAPTTTRPTTVIQFTVPGKPIAQPRHRHRKKGSGVYIPAKHAVHGYKRLVALSARSAYQGEPLTGPVRMDVVYVMPRAQRDKNPSERYPHIIKPDRDNLDKALKDALKGIAWADDCQVCAGESNKYVAAKGELPHVEVVITEI